MGHDTRDGMSYDEIAKELGVSGERVRQIEKNALQRLRNQGIRGRNILTNIARRHWIDWYGDG